jgi:hypothetical protein
LNTSGSSGTWGPSANMVKAKGQLKSKNRYASSAAGGDGNLAKVTVVLHLNTKSILNKAQHKLRLCSCSGNTQEEIRRIFPRFVEQ